MAEFISFQPSDFFNTKLYTGNGTVIGSGGLAITGVGFQPDFTWIKNRDAADNNMLEDAVRGATKYLVSNTNAAEATSAESLTTWGADGFTLGEDAAVNTNAEDYVSWNWKAGTTSGLSGGTITPNSYSFNTTSGVSIIEFDGNATAGATVPHGLGVAPQFIIVKKSSSTAHWTIYHEALGATKYLTFTTTAATAATTRWNDTAPTSTVFSLGDDTDVNGSGVTYMAYCFASVKGFSSLGSYVGNGNADGPFVYTGFKPSMIIRKTTGTDYWSLIDTKRLGFNPDNSYLFPSDSAAEGAVERVDILSNGFKVRTTDTAGNTDGTEYIYAAFAEFPVVSSNDVPAVAR